jgi:hypothetical protein
LSATNVKWRYCTALPDLVVSVIDHGRWFIARGTCQISVTFTIPPRITLYAGTYTHIVGNRFEAQGWLVANKATLHTLYVF